MEKQRTPSELLELNLQIINQTPISGLEAAQAVLEVAAFIRHLKSQCDAEEKTNAKAD